MDRKDECFPNTGVELDIPADAIFFMAETAVEPEPQANRRWAIGVDGKVRFSDNHGLTKNSGASGKPFGRPLGSEPVATVPPAEIAVFLDWLTSTGFFQLPTDVGPPDDMTVKGGSDRWIVVLKGVKTHCVRLRPGAAVSAAIKQRFNALVGAHMP